jgi:Methyltransferase domain
MSSITTELFRIYRESGYEPITGYSPYHFNNFRDSPFTIFVKNGQIVGLPNFGLALQEVMFIERFPEYIAPKNVLVIGNALGWSTVTLSLMFPKARTVAIDVDATGISATNELIERNKLPALAVTARSPDDVAAVVQKHLNGPVDFCLIDAIHTNEALLADFTAVRPVAAPSAIYLLHDVINWHMIDAVNRILSSYSLKGKIFTRTPSGMGLIYPSISPEFDAYLSCFSDPADRYQSLRQFFLTRLADPIGAFIYGYRPPGT